MIVDLRRIYYFTVVGRELHFGHAAAQLRIAQPALSQQVKKLEDELGMRLLRRGRGRPVELTAAGRVLLEEAEDVLHRVEHMASTARRAASGEIGHLRIGFIPSAANMILPLTVRAFRIKLPEVTLELDQLLIDPQIERLERGELDVGFVRPPIDRSRLDAKVVVRESLIVALPEKHRLAQRRRLSIGELAGEPFVMEPRWVAPSWFDNLLTLCRKEGFSPRIVQETTTMQTQLGLIAAGLGVALLPASISALRRAGLVTVPVDAPAIETLIVWQKGDVAPALAAFVNSALAVAHAEGLLKRRSRQTKASANETTDGASDAAHS